MGIYFLEGGSNQRPSNVIYDRAHSAIATITADSFNWDAIFDGAGWFHITGITPALSETAASLSLQAVQEAKAQGITVSCDYNYRKKLWQYGKTAPEVMTDLVRCVDVGIANEDDSLTPRGQTIIDRTPMRRFGRPEELLGTALWLLSPASAFVTGITVLVDGGFSAFSGV